MILPYLLFILLVIYFFYQRSMWSPQKSLFFSKDRIMRIGHRGSPLKAHENTINSFISSPCGSITENIYLPIKLY